MKKYKTRYSSIFEHLPMPVCLCTQNLRLLLYNKAFLNLLRIPDAKVPQSLTEYLSNSEQKRLLSFFEQLQERPNSGVKGEWSLRIGGKEHLLFAMYSLTEGYYVLQFSISRQGEDIRLGMYESIIHANQDAIFCTRLDGSILFLNEAAQKMYGYTNHELFEKNIELLFAEDSGLSEKIAHSLQLCGHFRGETEHQRKDGSRFPCSFHLNFIFDANRTPGGLALSCRDLTQDTKDRAAREKEDLFNSREEFEIQLERLRVYESIIENNWDSIVFSDLAGEILFVNPSTRKLYGYGEQELIGKNIEIFNLDDADHIASLVQGLKDFGGWSGEVRHRKKDGASIHVLLTVSMVFDKEGHPFALVSTSKDITEKVRAEREAQEKNRQLLEMKDRFVEELEEQVRKRTHELREEQEKSERLLRNVLPEQVASELKIYGRAKPKHYEQVSILFSDFVGFTRITERLSPQELITQLGFFFKEFDRISEEFSLEKIKTIGDAYMAAAGLPLANARHAYDAVRAALKMQALVKEAGRLWQDEEGKPVWALRIGIHSGPVIAGVVGSRKFAYDIWGDSVNVASRMESNSEAGRINISRTTQELVSDHFDCSYRGQIEAKNKGAIEMYFVEATHP